MPQAGQIVRVRSRQYLVEEVVEPATPGDDTLVRLACLEDDAQGEALSVLWEREADAAELGEASWGAVAHSGFDDPALFSAYLHTLRWSCVTSTNPDLFQAPYRAGIEVKAFQLEPLRKALRMPRVNLFIADDVGLGKTIEAGLIARELLIRQKIRRIVVACPPSVELQWQQEMESRFGLRFCIYDRDFVMACRRDRGWSTNPWHTHTRFIISHARLRDEDYATPLRDWLGDFRQGALLILDEAHNAAPSSGSRYAIDSKLTRTVEDISRRFEHRLFLSATPHNGHSNSFARLLEILDPQRFCRGVPVKGRGQLDDVMVRRIKSDLREVEPGFPKRVVRPIEIADLPDDAPELALSRLLAAYRDAKEQRLGAVSRSRRAAGMLVCTTLQKRLLSSIEAFARTLSVHHKAMLRAAAAEAQQPEPSADLQALLLPPDGDDERAELSDAELESDDDAVIDEATRASAGGRLDEELRLLDRMGALAEAHRHRPDPRLRWLVGWIKEHLCPELGASGARWLDRRVLIFTEFTDTKRYLQQRLAEALANSDREHERVRSFHGGIGPQHRERLKAAFNADPATHPLRILIATDAAREGVNLQNHCADLFHFDIPWNPSRMEQRNGRIDRQLQRAEVVTCSYFTLPQRTEDRVLQVALRKTEVIRDELGSLSPVLARGVDRLLRHGIAHAAESDLTAAIERLDGEADETTAHATIREELEAVRARKEELADQIAHLQDLLDESRRWIGLDDTHFRDTLSASLQLLGADALQPVDPAAAAKDPATAQWRLPALDRRAGADPTWAATLDALRAPRQKGQKLWEWRRDAPIRPVVFRDPKRLDAAAVHLHLEHRVVQRLLGRFLAQGFARHDLSRACVCLSDDPHPRVLVLGRLSLYGDGAVRLHDEIITAAAAWVDPDRRGRAKLKALTEGGKDEVLALLEASLKSPRLRDVPPATVKRLQAQAPADIAELLGHLEARAEVHLRMAQRDLDRRGAKEADAMRAILLAQQKRIQAELQKVDAERQFELLLDDAERRQRDADRLYWPKRLERLEREIEEEPARIARSYEVRVHRVDPVGVVYLWPVSGG